MADLSYRIAFVHATWHADIVQQSRLGFVQEMARLGVAADRIDVIGVPGALELPLHAKVLAESGRYGAVVAAALVVDGGLYRHEFVAQAVLDGLMRVQLDTGVPVISAVLTPHHFHEHEAHRTFFHDHFVTKGAEAAQATWHTVASLQRLKSLAG